MIRKFLQQPYSFYLEGKKLWQISCVILVLSTVYNLLVVPHKLYNPELKFSPLVIGLIHSVIPVLVLLVLAVGLRFLSTLTDNWMLRNELLLMATILFFVGLVDFLIRDLIYDNPHNWSWHYLFEELTNTLIGGLLLIVPVISINLNLQLFKNLENAESLNSKLESDRPVSHAKLISVKTPVLSEAFELDVSSLQYVRAEGNYLHLYFSDAPAIMKRMTLNSLEGLLDGLPYLLRIHRSFLVNLKAVEKVSGNAQGFKLKFKGSTDQVPVSRQYIDAFKEQMNHT